MSYAAGSSLPIAIDGVNISPNSCVDQTLQGTITKVTGHISQVKGQIKIIKSHKSISEIITIL